MHGRDQPGTADYLSCLQKITRTVTRFNHRFAGVERNSLSVYQYCCYPANCLNRGNLQVPVSRDFRFCLRAKEVRVCCGRARGADYSVVRLSRAAVIVREISASVCAAETNKASYCEGGRKIPRSSIAWKNFPNLAVSDFLASA